ncbi:hypothetical protein DFP72DRAFT_151208 [Ephemerocybe angulata]|uniref:Uncharacterized protein n=1 Tax=Ephemerocybe angulata TaxID=980116 RepID=A0A8H6I5H0_9AGAR|nr:hypothetical protein DFP72DRAFT_151208 [Tulosesus angulatus]
MTKALGLQGEGLGKEKACSWGLCAYRVDGRPKWVSSLPLDSTRPSFRHFPNPILSQVPHSRIARSSSTSILPVSRIRLLYPPSPRNIFSPHTHSPAPTISPSNSLISTFVAPLFPCVLQYTQRPLSSRRPIRRPAKTSFKQKPSDSGRWATERPIQRRTSYRETQRLTGWRADPWTRRHWRQRTSGVSHIEHLEPQRHDVRIF